jgi:hypothetical protein
MNNKQTWRLSDREVEIINAALQNLDIKVEFEDAKTQKILKNLISRFAHAVEDRNS